MQKVVKVEKAIGHTNIKPSVLLTAIALGYVRARFLHDMCAKLFCAKIFIIRWPSF